jgi:hypothetical protein
MSQNKRFDLLKFVKIELRSIVEFINIELFFC